MPEQQPEKEKKIDDPHKQQVPGVSREDEQRTQGKPQQPQKGDEQKRNNQEIRP